MRTGRRWNGCSPPFGSTGIAAPGKPVCRNGCSLSLWSGTVLSAFAPSDVYTAVTTALAPAQEKPTVDAIAAANVEEDIDYSIAQHAKSSAAGTRFLRLTPMGRMRRPRRPRSSGCCPRRRPSRLRSRSNPRRLLRRRALVEVRPQSPAPIARRRRPWLRRSRRRRRSRLWSRSPHLRRSRSWS